jgi:hypothetical protein
MKGKHLHAVAAGPDLWSATFDLIITKGGFIWRPWPESAAEARKGWQRVSPDFARACLERARLWYAHADLEPLQMMTTVTLDADQLEALQHDPAY